MPAPKTLDHQLATIAAAVRRMTSNFPGERAAAIEALGRILQKAQLDVINALAERIENGGGPALSDAELEQVFNAGIKQGRKEAKQKLGVNGAVFPDANAMALWCRARNDHLNNWEREFVNDIAVKSLRWPLSQKQDEKLRSIFLRLGGELLQ
jgi:hypothetical protein